VKPEIVVKHTHDSRLMLFDRQRSADHVGIFRKRPLRKAA
jgi:hypothetical protein